MSQTQFSDGLRAGSGTEVLVGQSGIQVSAGFKWLVIPAAKNATNVAVAQTVSGAAFTLAAGTGSTLTTINGVTYVDVGLNRCLELTGASGVTATPITITGKEALLNQDGTFVPGYTVVQTITGPGSGATVTTLKACRFYQSAVASGNTTSTVTIGTSERFGLPYRTDSFADIVGLNYDSTVITSSSGWTAASSVTATAATGDVRGTYTVPSATDGVKVLSAVIYPADVTTRNGIYGVAQFGG